MRTSCNSFQLPLSGSQAYQMLASTENAPKITFNSLSRDHHVATLGMHAEEYIALSTPSLGIT